MMHIMEIGSVSLEQDFEEKRGYLVTRGRKNTAGMHAEVDRFTAASVIPSKCTCIRIAVVCFYGWGKACGKSKCVILYLVMTTFYYYYSFGRYQDLTTSHRIGSSSVFPDEFGEKR
jgi:hypothetical protein